jgi:hypothetical protein
MVEMTKEEVDLKKYEAKLSLWKTGILGGLVAIITAVVSGFASVYISSQETQKEIELQIIKTQHDVQLQLIHTENEYVSNFMSNALDDNLEKRLRFSEYMSIVAPGSDQQRQKWVNYYEVTKIKYDETKNKYDEINAELDKLKETLTK